jgi:hypothetical protein
LFGEYDQDALKYLGPGANSKGVLHFIDIDNDSTGTTAAAWTVLLSLMHMRHDNIPETVSLDLLFKITKLADAYDCTHVLRGFAKQWLEPIIPTIRDMTPSDREFQYALFVTSELGHAELFQALVDKFALGTCFKEDAENENQGVWSVDGQPLVLDELDDQGWTAIFGRHFTSLRQSTLPDLHVR